MLCFFILQNTKDVLRHGELIGQSQQINLRLSLLLQIEITYPIQIGDLMVHLKHRDAIIHLIQLIFNHIQTTINKMSTIACQLISFIQPTLVVHLNNSIQHRLRIFR